MTTEIRKHVSDMTVAEKSFLMKRFYSLKFDFRKHARDRLNQRGIDFKDFLKTWKGMCQLVEYTRKGCSNRIMLRSLRAHKGKNILVVINLNTGEVVSLYWIYKKRPFYRSKAHSDGAGLDIIKIFGEVPDEKIIKKVHNF
ncbi:hypothetical protein 056SW001B_65 [Bacillus phage 056SW001B]|uniref:Uncharacterized protein n=1 Tax=Bacillus phage 056SW001B TaxID=2601663 RepID=A0A5P8PIN6_9CAUD|nr:hypothetical protein 056SW001B_65 [Bacillus phage 056SW001B]